MPESSQFTTRHYFSYLALLLIFGAGIWLILALGSRLNSGRPAVPSPAGGVSRSDPSATTGKSATGLTVFEKILRENLRNSLSILLLQLVVIIAAARLAGKLFRVIGQPPVLGEIVAGIVLGPSVLGLLSPKMMAFLFPAASMETLKLLGQIGVALFMFVVGMELDVQHLRKKAHTAIMVSNASIIVPFFLGALLSLWYYRSLAPPNASFTTFALFMGIAMSITAFPVLARILEDRRMTQTHLGSIALTCAAVDDVTAWCMLALVIAVAQSAGITSALLTITLALCFIGIMLLVVKPQLARRLTAKAERQQNSRGLVAGTLAFVMGCALLTEAIGIHALFGAFIAGVVMPQTAGLRLQLKEKLETFSSAVMLPLFFAFTGLRMQINLLNDWQSWVMCAVIVVVAIAGKLGASMLMARWTGMNWRDSFALGVLMNTRGLVELIVLNIGYDLGILSARTFAMMVLMALVTTFMTGPLLSLARIERRKEFENMKIKSVIGILILVLTCGVSAFAQKPDFSGSWTMDRARSFGLPGNMNQTMVVTQNGDQIDVETKLIQPNNERTVKDSYVLDGKEREFTPPAPAGAPPGQTPAKGKRTVSWMADGRGLLVTEVTTAETPKGSVTTQVVRKWTITNGELVIAMYVDSPNASYEAKRIFVKK